MDDAPKTALELAMERLRKKDVEEGVTDHSLTGEQKAAIADVRQTYGARLAQEEILYQTKLRASFDVDERQKMGDHYRRDVERLNHERDRKIEKIRSASDG